MDPVYIVPISGVDFVRYIAFYGLLASTPLRPLLILAASGGCMVSYMAMMSSFTQSILYWRINSQMFAYKHIPVVPRMVNFLLTGALYNRPNIEPFIHDSFVPSNLDTVEIITGYYGIKAGKLTLSTNKTSTESMLNANNFVLDGVNTEYNGRQPDLDGWLNRILHVIEATTNIPYLLPALGKHQLVDYGVHSPSPLTFLRMANGKPGLADKVVYMAPINVEMTSANNFYDLLFVNDVHTEINRLAVGYAGYETFRVDMTLPLADQLTFLSKLFATNRYLLVIYTTFNVIMSISNFTSFQANDTVKAIQKDIRFRLYT